MGECTTRWNGRRRRTGFLGGGGRRGDEHDDGSVSIGGFSLGISVGSRGCCVDKPSATADRHILTDLCA